VQIEYFTVNPDIIGGFLTTAERQALEHNRDLARHGARHFPAASPVARQFAELRGKISQVPTLAQRCHLLQLFAQALNLVPAHLRPDRLAQAGEKFQALINRLSERELSRYSVIELARMCGCSTRHFNRLFHLHFQQTIRDKFLLLRMQQAREQLQDTRQTIAAIAAGCGYAHLGYFSTTFKKHFGLTPSQWRKQHQ
jgi:AraC-like DNA-binding protein